MIIVERAIWPYLEFSLWDDYVYVFSTLLILDQDGSTTECNYSSNGLRLSFNTITYISDHVHDSRSKQ